MASGFRSAEPEGEQHVGGKHEAVADDVEVRAGAEHLAQLAEEIGAVARKLLHLLGKRDVQPLPEIGDLAWLSLSLASEASSASCKRGDLEPQRRELLVEDLDLGQRLVGDLLLLVELAAERGCLGLGALGLAALLAEQPGEARILLVLVDERRLQRGETVLDRLLLERSSASSSVSSESWRFSRDSMVSLPLVCVVMK